MLALAKWIAVGVLTLAPKIPTTSQVVQDRTEYYAAFWAKKADEGKRYPTCINEQPIRYGKVTLPKGTTGDRTWYNIQETVWSSPAADKVLRNSRRRDIAGPGQVALFYSYDETYPRPYTCTVRRFGFIKGTREQVDRDWKDRPRFHGPRSSNFQPIDTWPARK